MAWPDQTIRLRGDELALAQREVALIANAVAKYEPVWMYASHQNIAAAESYVSDNVTVVNVDVEQLWIRDSGPVLVTSTTREEVVGIDFNFNYFGGNSVRSTGFDRTFPYRLLTHHNTKRISASIGAEGGALEVDGEGTLLATESSFIKSKRNEDWSKAGMEDTFRELLGVDKTIWLSGVLSIDATDYPIDRLARFGRGSTVILSRPHRSVARSDPHYRAYEQARLVLSTSTNANGIPFDIVEIEEAHPSFSISVAVDDASVSARRSNRYMYERLQVMLGRSSRWTDDAADEYVIEEKTVAIAQSKQSRPSARSAAQSYLNFYFVNGGVIVPQFGDTTADQSAIEKMKELFPERTVEPVSVKWMQQAGRGLHDATLQWPSTKPGCW